MPLESQDRPSTPGEATSPLLDTVRVSIYTQIAESGAPPTSAEVAAQLGVPRAEALALFAELGRQRSVTLDPQTGELWMCGPFSAVPTRFRVNGSRASWWANCAWDMLGIPAALGIDVGVRTNCGCCGEALELAVDAQRGPTMGEGIAHFFLPARHWYEDIGYT